MFCAVLDGPKTCNRSVFVTSRNDLLLVSALLDHITGPSYITVEGLMIEATIWGLERAIILYWTFSIQSGIPIFIENHKILVLD